MIIVLVKFVHVNLIANVNHANAVPKLNNNKCKKMKNVLFKFVHVDLIAIVNHANAVPKLNN